MQARCVNRLSGRLLLKDIPEDLIDEYVKKNSAVQILIQPGFIFRGVEVLLKRPMLLGIKRKKKLVLLPFTKPCYGTILLEVASNDEEIAELQTMSGDMVAD
jgi:hypothetical protein